MLCTGLNDPEFSFIFLERQEWEPNRVAFANSEAGEYLMRVGGTIMPPSVFTDNLTASYYVTGRPPEAHLDARWDITDAWRKVVGAWNDLHGRTRSQQMQAYRSRLGFSCGALRANELERRIGKVKHQAKLLELTNRVRDFRDDAVMAWGEMWGRWARDLRIGEHTHKYVNEHKDSSVMPGVKWPQLAADPVKLKSAFLCVRDTYETISEQWEDCLLDSDRCLIASPQILYSGERQRPPDDFAGPTSHYNGVITRSRIIKYHVALSGFWAFHPSPNSCYKEWIRYLEDRCSFKVVCPVVQGGLTWEIMRNKISEGCRYLNCDASGWDTHYPAVLNVGGPIATVYDAVQGGSGFAPTSQAGSGAQIIMDEALVQTTPGLYPEMVGVLGDDGGWVLPEGSKATPEVPAINEIDQEGSDLLHYLGLSMLDESRWHPTGFKVTIDRAGRGRRLRPMEQIYPPLRNDYSEEERATIVGVYIGLLPDGRTTREVLRQTDLSKLDYISPSMIRGQLMSDALESSSDLERSGDDSEP